MPSLVEQVADLQLSQAQQEAHHRLTAAQRALDMGDLTAFPSEKAARIAKLSALVDLDWFAAVTEFADVQTHPGELVFLSYALYRLGRLEELRKVVGTYASQPQEQVGARLALAQAEYKAGNFDAARKVLEECEPFVSEEDREDMRVNKGAIDVYEGVLLPEQGESFDDKFNRAYGLLVRGRIEDALELLKEANGLAEEDEDRQAAIAQAAYANILAGNRSEARALHENLKTSKLTSAVDLVVLHNDAIAAYEPGSSSSNSTADLVTIHRTLLNFDHFSEAKLSAVLNTNQRQIIRRNKLKLLSRAGIKNARKLAVRHAQEFGSDEEPRYAAFYNLKGVDLLKRELGDSKALRNIYEGNGWQCSPRELSSFLSSSEFCDGDSGSLVSAVVHALAGERLEAVGSYFDSLRIPELKQAGKTLLDSNCKVSGEMLHSIDSLVSSVDISNLEKNVLAQHSRYSSSKPSLKRKRSGKRKLPATYDPEKEPNPERWLPKEERSDYKPKKKKASKATQGAAVVPDEPAAAPGTGQVVGAKPKRKSKKKGKK